MLEGVLYRFALKNTCHIKPNSRCIEDDVGLAGYVISYSDPTWACIGAMNEVQESSATTPTDVEIAALSIRPWKLNQLLLYCSGKGCQCRYAALWDRTSCPVQSGKRWYVEKWIKPQG